jgi:hypothetical protein
MQMYSALKYLTRFKFLPADYFAKPEVETLIKSAGWEVK